MKSKFLVISLLSLSLVACGSKNITSTYNEKIYYRVSQSGGGREFIGFEDDKLYFVNDITQRVYTYTSTTKDYVFYKYEYAGNQTIAYLSFSEDYTTLDYKIDVSIEWKTFNLDKENIYSLNDLKKRL